MVKGFILQEYYWSVIDNPSRASQTKTNFIFIKGKETT